MMPYADVLIKLCRHSNEKVELKAEWVRIKSYDRHFLVSLLADKKTRNANTLVKGLSNLKPFRIKIIFKRILLKDETKNI